MGTVPEAYRTEFEVLAPSPHQVNGGLVPCSPNRLPVDYAPVRAPGLELLFREQQRFLNYFFDHLEYEPLERLCQACLACKGALLFTGIGKSGFIAQKVCQTLVSTGTKALFLSPTDALHGDLGIVSHRDLLIMLSKSGCTDELIKLVPYAKAKGAKLVCVTCVAGARLAEMCDLAVHLPLERELCPFDLAPVTSTAIQMLFGDTIAIALMQARNLTRDEFAMNHPAGRIGRRLILRVADVMHRCPDVPSTGPGTLVMDALAELSAKGLGCILVVAPDGSLLGTFTDGDLRRTLQQRGAQIMETTIAEVMHSSPRTTTSDTKAVDAMQAMEEPPRKVTFFPVTDGGRLVGLVTLHALVSAGL